MSIYYAGGGYWFLSSSLLLSTWSRIAMINAPLSKQSRLSKMGGNEAAFPRIQHSSPLDG